MQVPADQVIAILTQELGDMHRENAILKVQVTLLNSQVGQLQNAVATPAPAEINPTAAALPPVPANGTSPIFDATTSSLAAQGDVVPAPNLNA